MASIPYVNSPGANPAGANLFTTASAAYLAALRKKMLAPNTAYGLLNPGTTTPGSTTSVIPPPDTSGTTPPPTTAGHWSVPDYEALIAADPGFAAANAQISAAGEDASGARRAAVQRAIIESGFTPSGYADQYGDIDPTTLAAAGENPMSTLSRLQQARTRGSADLSAVLAGRGMLSSGGLTGGEQRLLEGFQGGQYSASQSLLDALYGYGGTYASTFDLLNQRKLAAQRDAALTQAALHPAGWVTDPSGGVVDPTTDPSSVPNPYVPYVPPVDTPPTPPVLPTVLPPGTNPTPGIPYVDDPYAPSPVIPTTPPVPSLPPILPTGTNPLPGTAYIPEEPGLSPTIPSTPTPPWTPLPPPDQVVGNAAYGGQFPEPAPNTAYGLLNTGTTNPEAPLASLPPVPPAPALPPILPTGTNPLPGTAYIPQDDTGFAPPAPAPPSIPAAPYLPPVLPTGTNPVPGTAYIPQETPFAPPPAVPAPPAAPALTGEQAYLQANPDVAAAVAAGQFPSGYAHYLAYGQSEGRGWTGDPGVAPAPAAPEPVYAPAPAEPQVYYNPATGGYQTQPPAHVTNPWMN